MTRYTMGYQKVFIMIDWTIRALPKWGLVMGLWVLMTSMQVSAQSDTAAMRTLELHSGQQETVSFTSVIEQTAIAGNQIVEVSVLSDKTLLITPQRAGLAVLRVWLEDFNQPRQIEIRVTPSAFDELDTDYSLTLGAEVSVLSGDSQSLDEHALALAAIGDNMLDASRQYGVQVQTDIRVVEVNKRLLESSGFFIGRNTPGATRFGVGRSDSVLSFLSGGDISPGAGTGGFSVIRANTSGVMAALSALRTNGFASVLAEPSVVSLSGQSASFLVGGEFPVPVQARDEQVTIEYKEFGVRLQLTPTVLDEHRILLKVAPEVSELDFNNAVRTGGVAVPSLNVRRTDTTVQLGNGESFIISGLVSNSTSQNTEGIPGLSDVPILGALFRSTRFERDERELIMIVTPHLVEPIAAGVSFDPLPGEALRRYQPMLLELLLAPKDAEFIENNTDIGFSR